MNKKPLRLLTIYALFLCVCIGSSSCLSIKEVRLFQNLPDSTTLGNIKLPKFVPPLIKNGDILSVTVITNDPSASLGVNNANALVTSSPVGDAAIGAGAGGYLVNKDGYIEMPVIGKIQVTGLTIDAAREVIKEKVGVYFTDPIIIIKSVNLKITILGEVQKPGTYNISNEKVTIVDALAYSGDFTSFARRDNVLLLRQNSNNTLSTIRIDIKKSEILQSPYYYLQSNDVIYVEPNKGKAFSSDVIFTRNVAYITLATSFLTTLLLIFRR